MVAVPSRPDLTSRIAPVALLTTEILASRTAAPAWSITSTTIVAVLGDCAVAIEAKNIKSKMADETEVFIIFSFGISREGAGRESRNLNVPATADQKEIDGYRPRPSVVCVFVAKSKARARHRCSGCRVDRGREDQRRFAGV